MAIFSKNNTPQVEKKTRFIGGYIPQETMSYLALYTLVKSDSKTTLLKKALSLFVDILKKEHPINHLKEQLIIRIRRAWALRRIDSGDIVQYNKFKKDVENELKQKGISKALQQSIIQEL